MQYQSIQGPALIFLVINVAALLLLSRRWAPVALLAGGCFMTLGQAFEIGPFHFTFIRIMIAAGFVRILLRRERIVGRLNKTDCFILAWAGWLLLSSSFHNDPNAGFVMRAGMVFTTCGFYFLLRIFCASLDDVVALYRAMAVLLVPLAAAMLFEKISGHNPFAIFGGVPEISYVRRGAVRAQGPFSNYILAGSAAASCLPLIVGLWYQYRKTATAAIVACMVIVLACASSGPLLSTLAAIGALFMWRFRGRMAIVRWIAVLGYLALDLVMRAPAYFILARIDLVGGSTGWHRARLIQSAIEHLNEWWLFGTDYTRHWMPTGIHWSVNHTDITNQYLEYGVMGGLLLMMLFIGLLVSAFSQVGKKLVQQADFDLKSRFMTWALGASLFVHSVTFLSATYYDQTILFLVMNLAAIGYVHVNRDIVVHGSESHAIVRPSYRWHMLCIQILHSRERELNAFKCGVASDG